MSVLKLVGDRWVGWGLCGLAFVVPFLWWEPLLDSSELPRWIAMEVVGTAMLTLLLARYSWSQPRAAVRLPIMAWPVVGFLLMTLASNIWAHHSGSALIASVHVWGSVVLFFLSVYATQQSYEFPITLAGVSVTAAACLSVLAIMQNFGYLSILFFQIAPPAATMINKNIFAQYLDTILIPSLFLLLTTRSRMGVALCGSAFALILTCVFISYTRGAWLGMLVGGGAFFAVAWRYSDVWVRLAPDLRRAKVAAVSIAVLFALGIMQIPTGISSHSFASKIKEMVDHPEEGSSSFRLAVDQNTWYMLRDHPEGVGIGNWKHVYPMYSASKVRTPQVDTKTQPEQMHNDPYVFFAELGWLGGLFFCAIFLTALWSSLLCWRQRATDQTGDCSSTRLLSVALMAALLDVGTHSLVSFPFHSPTSSMQIWLWLGVVGGLTLTTNRGGGTVSFTLPSIPLRILALASAMTTIFVIRFSMNAFTANALFKPIYALSVVKEQVMCALTDRIDQAQSKFPYDFRIDRNHVIQHIFCDKETAHALKLAKAELEKEPYYLNNLINLMPVAFTQKDYALLKQVSKRLVEFFPWRADGYHGLAVAALQEKKYAEAERLFRQALKRDPKYQPSLTMLTSLEKQLKDFYANK